MVGIYAFSKLVGGGSSDEPAKAEHVSVVKASVSSGENAIPSILAPEFEEWSKVPGNMKRWEDSLKDWKGDA